MKIWIKNPLTIWTGNDLPAPTHGLLIEGVKSNYCSMKSLNLMMQSWTHQAWSSCLV